MGVYDTYGKIGAQIKAGACIMHHYKLGEKCDLDDGIYLDYGAAIVIKGSKFIAEFPVLFDKWGGIITPESIIAPENSVQIAVNKLLEDNNENN